MPEKTPARSRTCGKMRKKYDQSAGTMEKCLKKHPPGAKCYKMPPTRPQEEDLGALKIQKIWGLKKVDPESIFANEKRFLAAQAPTVGFGG